MAPSGSWIDGIVLSGARCRIARKKSNMELMIFAIFRVGWGCIIVMDTRAVVATSPASRYLLLCGEQWETMERMMDERLMKPQTQLMNVSPPRVAEGSRRARPAEPHQPPIDLKYHWATAKPYLSCSGARSMALSWHR